MLQYDRTCNHVGVLFSVLSHALALAVLAGMFAPKWNDFAPAVIYSVTLEGGKSLGGVSQVPKDDKEQSVAPPKKVSGAEEEAQLKAAKDAEVSLAEKRKAEEEKRRLEKKKLEEQKKKEEEKKKLEEKKKQEKKPNITDINKRLNAAMQRYSGESTDAGGQGFGSGALGGKKMGGGVVRPPAFFLYRDQLKSHIKQGWRWFDTSAELLAIVEFEIKPDGTLDHINLVQGSGNGPYDESVLRAVYKASPVPPPPAEVYEQFFKSVTMRFDPRE